MAPALLTGTVCVSGEWAGTVAGLVAAAAARPAPALAPTGNLRLGTNDGSAGERSEQGCRRRPSTVTMRVGDGFGFHCVRVGRVSQLPAELDALGLRRGRPVLVLVGGAGGMGQDDLALMDTTLRAAVLPVLEQHDAAVVDGGTDSGVMRVVGQARAATGGHFPLVGVAAEGTVVVPDRAELPAPDAAELEPHHTHVVLIPGTSWGDESPWLADVADAIADDHPSVTLVVNGGKITYDDIERSLARHRPVLVLAGTGRTADAVAAALTGRGVDPRAAKIAASPLTRILEVRDVDAIADALSTALGHRGADR